jgi:hypothetical protein
VAWRTRRRGVACRSRLAAGGADRLIAVTGRDDPARPGVGMTGTGRGWGLPVIWGLPVCCRAAGHDVRAAGTAGADIVRITQARARSMATGTGLVTMSRTGEKRVRLASSASWWSSKSPVTLMVTRICS